MGSASSRGIAAARDAVGERRALEQFHHQRGRGVRQFQA